MTKLDLFPLSYIEQTLTWKPFTLMISLTRSTMNISSSSSMKAMSPVCSHPSLSNVLAVACGSFKYPAIQFTIGD